MHATITQFDRDESKHIEFCLLTLDSGEVLILNGDGAHVGNHPNYASALEQAKQLWKYAKCATLQDEIGAMESKPLPLEPVVQDVDDFTPIASTGEGQSPAAPPS